MRVHTDGSVHAHVLVHMCLCMYIVRVHMNVVQCSMHCSLSLSFCQRAAAAVEQMPLSVSASNSGSVRLGGRGEAAVVEAKRKENC